MLLVCASEDRIELGLEKEKGKDYVPHYPFVYAAIDEGDIDQLKFTMSALHNPFVVRISDKDVEKILRSDAAKRAIKKSKNG